MPSSKATSSSAAKKIPPKIAEVKNSMESAEPEPSLFKPAANKKSTGNSSIKSSEPANSTENSNSDSDSATHHSHSHSASDSVAASAAAELDPSALSGVLESINSALKSFSSFSSLNSQVSSGSLSTSAGISLLDVKSLLFIQYMQRLIIFTLAKLRGQHQNQHESLSQSHPSSNSSNSSLLLSLIRLRTIIEKIRPMEKKLKYGMEKLLKFDEKKESAELENEENNNEIENANADPLKFKPNPSMMNDNDEDSDDDEANADSSSALPSSANRQPGLYRPLQISNPSDYTASERSTVRSRRDAGRLKTKLSKSSMIQSLYADASEAPEESLQEGAIRQHHVDVERTRYEEDNFVRLMETRKDKARKSKHLRNQMHRNEDFDDFEDFNDIEKALKSSNFNQRPSDEGNFDPRGESKGGKRKSFNKSQSADSSSAAGEFQSKKRRKDFGHAPTKKFMKKRK